MLQSEKQLWSKFFCYLPMPATGNKLGVGTFIPPGLRDRVKVPEVLCRSRKLDMPPPEAIPPGKHFIKFNNGSGDLLRLTFPLNARDRNLLDRWLAYWRATTPMSRRGEWWYDTFPRKVFIERAIDADDTIEEWKFQVFNGRCDYIVELHGQTPLRSGVTAYDRDGNHIPVRIADRNIGTVRTSLPDFALMLEAAEAIAQRISFARVDFYRTQAGQIYLGEITLCPFNTLGTYSDSDFNRRTGEAWNHRSLYER